MTQPRFGLSTCIEIDKLCYEDLMKLGTEGYYFPKVQPSPFHECMVIDLELMAIPSIDVDRDRVVDLLMQFTEIPRNKLERLALIYVNWEVDV